MTYGDDNIMGVSDSTPWFNHTSIQKVFKDIDIVYTMADKEAESVPYINISDASFLKRSWRWDDMIEEYMPTIESDSIQRSLMVWVESKSICKQEQMIEVITSAMGEYFFYGKKEYESKTLMFQHVIKQLNLELWVKDNTFTPYEDLAEKFKGTKTLRELGIGGDVH
jgi:hypothetical protein